MNYENCYVICQAASSKRIIQSMNFTRKRDNQYFRKRYHFKNSQHFSFRNNKLCVPISKKKN